MRYWDASAIVRLERAGSVRRGRRPRPLTSSVLSFPVGMRSRPLNRCGRPPTDRGNLVQVHDDRDVFHASTSANGVAQAFAPGDFRYATRKRVISRTSGFVAIGTPLTSSAASSMRAVERMLRACCGLRTVFFRA